MAGMKKKDVKIPMSRPLSALVAEKADEWDCSRAEAIRRLVRDGLAADRHEDKAEK